MVTGGSTEYVRVGDQGTKFTFRFCPLCGATVYYTAEGIVDLVAVPVGAFADSEFPPPTISVYAHRKHHWLQMPAEFEHIP